MKIGAAAGIFMGSLKNVWSVDLQHCKTSKITVNVWLLDSNVGFQQKDPGTRISRWWGDHISESHVARTVSQVHDNVQLGEEK